MNGTNVITAEHAGEESRAKVVAGSSLMEAFGAIATIALAIVGLARIWPMTMAAIATIVVGAASLIEGGALGYRYSRRTLAAGTQLETSESTCSGDFLGGLAAVVLGILALLGIAPATLVAVAVLALGATFAFSDRFFVGLAAVVLGILAICQLAPETLFLVALLVLGAGLLMTGSRIAFRSFASA